MSNSKISALTSATTPLAGTETLPVVQSSATTKVTVANLTAGRAVSALSYTSTTGASFATTSGSVGIGTASPARKLEVFGSGAMFDNNGGAFEILIGDAAYRYFGLYTPASPDYIAFRNGTTQILKVDALNNDVIAPNGNFVPSTAAKGVNFTANTPAAGMTSQLLNWYETGTWTPVVTASSGSITSYTSSGNYTRVGNVVTVSGFFTITNNGTGSGNGNVSGLPFTVGGQGASGCSRSAAAGGHMVNIQVLSGGTSFTMWKYDNTYPFLTSSQLAFSFSYLV